MKNTIEVSREDNIQKIDASNKFIMPGIIDAHCHITFDEPTSNDELFFIEDRLYQLSLQAIMQRRFY